MTAAVDLARWRADTPGTARLAHFNNAGAALQPQPVLDAVTEYLAFEAVTGGYEAAAAREDAVQAVYASVAKLIGAQARDIALTQSATDGFARALLSIPFAPGDEIVTTRADYISSFIQFDQLAKRFGVETVIAPDDANGVVDVAALADLARTKRAKLVVVAQIPTHSGRVQDVAAVGAALKDVDTLYLVDGCQAAGQVPVDVAAIGCDFFSAASRKFLRGPRGAGFLYVAPRVIEQGLAPLTMDLHSARLTAQFTVEARDDAVRFEEFERSIAVALGLGAAADYALGLGVEVIDARLKTLAADLRRRLPAVPGVRLFDEGENRCAIIPIIVEGEAAASVKARLAARAINVSVVSPDFQPDNAELARLGGAARVSPHYYNDEADVERLLEALAG